MGNGAALKRQCSRPSSTLPVTAAERLVRRRLLPHCSCRCFVPPVCCLVTIMMPGVPSECAEPKGHLGRMLLAT